ncbi:MAG TPA: glycosyltransferase family 4 protein [Methanoregulaceae archaeon]|nr:glycosyltransferase family 4 protein [Methanoregulaceae archaeon]
MESLKLGFFCWESLHAVRLGGLANAATHLAEALAKNHEVHFFTRGESPDREVAGVSYHYCQPEGENIVDYCRSMSRQMVDRFAQVDGNFDYLHFHDWHTVEALRALQDRDTIFSFHSTEFGRHGNTVGTEQIYRDITEIERTGAHLAQQVTAVSGVLRDEVVSLYEIPEEKCEVVPNGVIPREYQRTVSAEMVKKEYGVPPDAPMIFFIGRLEHQKGPDLLLDGVPDVLGEHPDAHLLIAGNGLMLAGLQATVRGMPVRFLGLIPDAEYVRLLNAADLVVIPSRNEPFGLVLLEAWSASRAVVATNVGGLSENIDHLIDGVKVAVSSAAIAQGINRVIGNPSRLRALGAEGRQKIESRFRWDAIAGTFTGIYRAIGS